MMIPQFFGQRNKNEVFPRYWSVSHNSQMLYVYVKKKPQIYLNKNKKNPHITYIM